MTIEFRPIESLAPVRQTLLDLYAQVRANLLDHPNYRLDVFAERLDRHAAEPDWLAMIGYDGDTAFGYIYGNVVHAGNRWWKRMNPAVPDEYTREPAIALKEGGLLTPWRNSGVSRDGHDALLAGRTEPYVSLLVNPLADNGKLQAVYESWGYHRISTQQPSPESPLLHALIRRTHPDQDEQ
jgi:hypothetical protein